MGHNQKLGSVLHAGTMTEGSRWEPGRRGCGLEQGCAHPGGEEDCGGGAAAPQPPSLEEVGVGVRGFTARPRL